MYTLCIQNGYTGKVSKGKDSLVKTRLTVNNSKISKYIGLDIG